MERERERHGSPVEEESHIACSPVVLLQACCLVTQNIYSIQKKTEKLDGIVFFSLLRSEHNERHQPPCGAQHLTPTSLPRPAPLSGVVVM